MEATGGRHAVRTRVIGAVILAVAAALRLWDLDRQSLWLDEGFTLAYARTASLKGVLQGITACSSTDCASPLYPLVLGLVLRIFGDSVEVLRGGSGIAGIAFVLVMMRVAGRLGGSVAMVIAGLVSATSGYAIWYSQEARAYSLLMLLTGIQVWALLECRERGSEDWVGRAVLAVATGLAVLASILSLLGTTGLALAHLSTDRAPRRWRGVWWPAALLALPAVALYAMAHGAGATAAQFITPLAQNPGLNIAYSAYGLLVGITLGPPQALLRASEITSVLLDWLPLLLLVAGAGVLVVAVVAAGRRVAEPGTKRAAALELLLRSVLISIILSIGVMLCTSINWQPRHSYFLAPQLILLYALGGAALLGQPGKRGRTLVVPATALLIFLNAWSACNYFTDARYAKDDYRGAARFLGETRREGVTTALLAGSPLLIRYYGESGTEDLTDVKGLPLVRRLQQIVGEKGVLVVALNREFSWLEGLTPEEVVGPYLQVEELPSLPYFKFYSLSRKAVATGTASGEPLFAAWTESSQSAKKGPLCSYAVAFPECNR